jgi:hypothetical protein
VQGLNLKLLLSISAVSFPQDLSTCDMCRSEKEKGKILAKELPFSNNTEHFGYLIGAYFSSCACIIRLICGLDWL